MWSEVGQEVESFYMPLGMMNLQLWRCEEWRTQKTDWGERDTVKEKEKAGQSQHPREASKQKLEAEVQEQPTASSSHW